MEPAEHWRPRRRSDCASVPRPCPYVGCRYNLFLDVHGMPAGARGTAPPAEPQIRGNFPGKEPCDMAQSCALDVAEQGPKTCEEVGEVMGWSKQYTHLKIKQMLRRIRPSEEQRDAWEAAQEHEAQQNAPYRLAGAGPRRGPRSSE